MTHKSYLNISDDFIRSERYKILITINGFYISFLWKLGKYFIDNKRENDKDFLINTSKRLVPVWGGIFSVENINLTIDFVKLIPDYKDSSLLSTLITWDYLKVLIPLNNLSSLLGFIQLCNEENYSLKTLKESVNQAISEKDSLINPKQFQKFELKIKDLFHENVDDLSDKNSNFKHIDYHLETNMSDNVINQLFSEDLKTILKKVPKEFNKKISSQSSISDLTDNTIGSFRYEMLKFINSGYLNLLWQVGDFFQNNHIKDDRDFISNESLRLSKKWGNSFSIDNINYAKIFCSNIKDRFDLSSLIQFATWDCLKVLLPLKDPELIYSYIQLCIEKNYTVEKLNEIIQFSEDHRTHNQLPQVKRKKTRLFVANYNFESLANNENKTRKGLFHYFLNFEDPKIITSKTIVNNLFSDIDLQKFLFLS